MASTEYQYLYQTKVSDNINQSIPELSIKILMHYMSIVKIWLMQIISSNPPIKQSILFIAYFLQNRFQEILNLIIAQRNIYRTKGLCYKSVFRFKRERRLN